MKSELRLLWRSTSPAVLAKHPEWIVDAVTASYIDPSNTVIVTGFWRSGTTWLQESLTRALTAKSVFEPLHPEAIGYKSYVKSHYRGRAESSGGYMPFVPVTSYLREDPRLETHILRALTGGVPGVFHKAARDSNRIESGVVSKVKARLREASRMRVVTKFLRGHLISPHLQTLVTTPLIHIRRDPRAVIESMLRQSWADWIREISLEKLLLDNGDKRSKVFQRWTGKIRHSDAEDDFPVRLGIYWAFTEWYVDEFSDKTVVIDFDRLCTEGVHYLNKRFNNLGLPKVSPVNIEKESQTSSDANLTKNRRINRWKSNLDTNVADRLEKRISDFGLESMIP